MKNVKNEVYYPLLGQILYERYHITQVLSSGAFGQTYLAKDISQSDKPQCVVKHHRLLYNYPGLLNTSRRILINEAKILKQVGCHGQIPQLLACFEENQWLCLVQELVEGVPLSQILPFKPKQEQLWQPTQVGEFLEDILGVVKFIHSQKVIHGDIKPNNIIQRSGDRKYVLIDFGSSQNINPRNEKPVSTLPESTSVKPLGFIAPEQLIGFAYPSSDLYSVGMVAIKALTGLEPDKLPQNPQTGEIDWQKLMPPTVAIDGEIDLLAILQKMVRYDPMERYQSAEEIMEALKNVNFHSFVLSLFEPISQVVVEDKPMEKPVEVLSPIAAERVESPQEVEKVETAKQEQESESVNRHYLLDYSLELMESAFSQFGRLPIFVKGMGIGMAVTNLVAIGFGTYSLVNTMGAAPELDKLREASRQYQEGNLFEALSIAESISEQSPVFEESRTAATIWQQQWQQAQKQFSLTQQAFEAQQWFDVLETGNKIPQIEYWQKKATAMMDKAYFETEGIAKQLLNKAFEAAKQRDFTSALGYLEQIHPRTETGRKIQPKLAEYRRKEQIRATYLLQQAYDSAEKREFGEAINYLERIPEDTKAAQLVSEKVAEYGEKQKIREVYELNVKWSQQKQQNNLDRANILNPGSQLREITIQSPSLVNVDW